MSLKKIKEITIIGPGLIGASIGLALKRKNISTSPNKFDELMARYYEEYLQVSDQFTEVYDGVVDVLNDLKVRS